MTHAVDQRGPHTLLERPPRCASSAFLRAAVSIGDGKVSPRRPDPRGVDPNRRAGRKRANAAIDREGFRNGAEQIKSCPPGRLRVARYISAGNQRFDLRRKSQRAPVIGIIERLDAIMIARQQETAFLRIPQRECKHATKAMHHGGAFGGIKMDQHLGVRSRAKAISLRLELAAQRAMIIDLAIADDDNLPIRAPHRLSAKLGKLDDRQPPVTKPDPAIGRVPLPETVRPACRHVVAHATELRMIHAGHGRPIRIDSSNAAHSSDRAKPRGHRCRYNLLMCATRNEPIASWLVMALATLSGIRSSRDVFIRPLGIGRISPLSP